MDYLVKLEGYGLSLEKDGSEHLILRDLNLEVKPGEIVGLIGASGSGKSMTARAIMRLFQSYDSFSESGSLSLVTAESPQSLITTKGYKLAAENIGLVFQQSAKILNPSQKIGDQIAERLILSNIPKPQLYQKVTAMLADLELHPAERFYDSYPHQLSGGQMQRALLALAFINKPKLLIADEPFSSLDTKTRTEILALIKSIHEKYKTSILLISHNLNLVESICDRLYFIDKGSIIESGTTKTIFSNPTTDLVKQHVSLHGITRSKSALVERSIVLFELKGVSKSFASQAILSDKRMNEHQVLDAFSMKIHEGEILGLVGPSGSGKSTIGRMLLRLENVDDGQILYQGNDIHLYSKNEMRRFRQECQIIFQDPLSSMSPHRTVEQHFQDASSVIRRAYSRVEVIDYLAQVEIDGSLLDRMPMQLSGGQRQRILIARVLYMQSRFIVCDEIFSSLDRLVAQEILGFLLRLVEKFSLTLLVISHDKTLLKQVCDRIVSLKG